VATLLTTPLRVRVTWVDNASNETNFMLERAVNGGAFIALATTPARNGAGNVTFNDTTVTIGNSYSYRVKAVNGLGSSAYSNTSSVSVLIPAAPTNTNAVVARNGGNDRVTLTWTDNANNETGFRIQRATNAAFTAGLTTTTIAANTVTFTQSVARARTYYYRIQVYNSAGASVWVNFTPSPIVTP
jgi:hypothetical protein